MENTLIISGILIVAILMYFNSVATIITLKESGIGTGVKIARIIFVWLIPIIGFGFTLRFSFQAEESPLHHSLVPAFICKWIYDESIHPANKNRDDNDLKAVNGISTYDHGSRD